MREGRGKETGKRREAEEEEGSSAAEEAGGKADSRVHASKIWESRGGGRLTRRKGKYPMEAQTTAGRSCRRPMGVHTRGRAGADRR